MKKKNLKLYAILTALGIGVLVGVVFIFQSFLDTKNKTVSRMENDQIANFLMEISDSYEGEFWKYKEQIKTISFEENVNVPVDVVESWDVSESKNGSIIAYIKNNINDSNYYDLYIQSEGKIYANQNSSYLFENFKYVDSINNIELLDTSKVTDMRNMFYHTGYESEVFSLDLGDNFDTSNVTNMYFMFTGMGHESEVFTLNLGNKFDTSNVTDMNNMFRETGYNSTVFILDLGDKFDTSSVTDMGYLFRETGHESTVFTLDLGDKFDTRNVTEMNGMFHETGFKSTVFTLDLGDKFDTSKVIDMDSMFRSVGRSSTVFTLDLGDKFNTRNVTDMSSMFRYTGSNSEMFKIDCSDWDVWNVTEYTNFYLGVETKVIPPAFKK